MDSEEATGVAHSIEALLRGLRGSQARLTLRTCNALRVSAQMPAIPRMRCLMRISAPASVLCVLSDIEGHFTRRTWVGLALPLHLRPREVARDSREASEERVLIARLAIRSRAKPLIVSKRRRPPKNFPTWPR